MQGQVLSQDTMTEANITATTSLVLRKNVRGGCVCELSVNDELVFATTHPATIVAALQAMELAGEETTLTLQSGDSLRLPLHDYGSALIAITDAATLRTMDEHERKFLLGARTFLSFDFFNPDENDEEADIHLRTAVHHLPKGLVKRTPTGPAPSNWKKLLKERNQFVYYPIC